jgi:nucleoid-associated protein YgaU
MVTRKRFGMNAAKAKYMAIYEANKDVIGGNPNVIIPGQVLKIPKFDK